METILSTLARICPNFRVETLLILLRVIFLSPASAVSNLSSDFTVGDAIATNDSCI
jgi:hypothetical protein